jgi:hypothetical protein
MEVRRMKKKKLKHKNKELQNTNKHLKDYVDKLVVKIKEIECLLEFRKEEPYININLESIKFIQKKSIFNSNFYKIKVSETSYVSFRGDIFYESYDEDKRCYEHAIGYFDNKDNFVKVMYWTSIHGKEKFLTMVENNS